MGEKSIMNTLKTVGTTLLLISLVSGLAGCATSGGGSSVLPQSGPSMSEIYDHQYDFGSNSNQLDQVRSQVPKTSYQTQPVDQKASPSESNQESYSSDNQTSDAPNMLPNAMISIYVYPHFDGDDQDYVPGHKAYTKLYKEAHFALPGEATEME